MFLDHFGLREQPFGVTPDPHFLYFSPSHLEALAFPVGRMYGQFNEALVREARAGRRVVVVIDEAQNLEDSVFETVRLLSNFEIPGMKLMQILLAGQPQLADKLATRNLVQLRQRVSILSRLTQFNSKDTARYVSHRLKVAGYRSEPLFTADALEIIHSRSDGIPRNINNLCFHALTLGFAIGHKTIDASILNEVLGDLDIETLGSNTPTDGRCGEQKSSVRDYGPWSASKWIRGNTHEQEY